MRLLLDTGGSCKNLYRASHCFIPAPGDLQNAVIVKVLDDQSLPDELAREKAPVFFRILFADPIRGKRMVAEIDHLFGLGAPQNIYYMIYPEPLPGPLDA